MIKIYKDDKVYHVPTAIEELTLGQYQAFQEARKKDNVQIVDLISAVSELPANDVSSIDPNDLDVIFDGLNDMALGVNRLMTMEASRTITVSGQEVKPKEWGLQTTSARVQYLQRIGIEGNDMDEYLSAMLALVVGRELYGNDWEEWEDWDERLKDVEFEVKQALAIEAVPLAYFFLRKQASTKRFGINLLNILLSKAIKKPMAKIWRYLVRLI